MTLNYKKYGEQQPTIIILHGLFGMLDNWHNIAKMLSEKFTVYSVDVRNHGGSPHSDVMTYAEMCHDIAEFCETHAIHKAHFVGHSMGGKLVMSLADLYPQLIDKLVVVDIAPKKYKPGHLELFKAMFDLPIDEINSRSEAENMLKEVIPEAGIRLFLLKNLQRNPDSGYSWKMNLKAIYSNYESIIGAITLGWPFSNETLFIKGENSNYISESDESVILEMFPNASFETIENAGHWVHAENPKDFFNCLVSFLH